MIFPYSKQVVLLILYPLINKLTRTPKVLMKCLWYALMKIQQRLSVIAFFLTTSDLIALITAIWLCSTSLLQEGCLFWNLSQRFELPTFNIQQKCYDVNLGGYQGGEDEWVFCVLCLWCHSKSEQLTELLSNWGGLKQKDMEVLVEKTSDLFKMGMHEKWNATYNLPFWS